MFLIFGIPALLCTTSIAYERSTVHRIFQYQRGVSVTRDLNISIKDAHRA
jgi:hypothetical protein